MQFRGKINELKLIEKGKDENSQTAIELKVFTLLSPKMDVNEFVRLFKKDVVIDVNMAQEELEFDEDEKEKEEVES